MIYTFTPNPAIDYYIDISDFTEGKINRAEDGFFRIAGKGINCSIVLDHLGMESTACFFSGGFTGRHIIDSLGSSENIIAKPFMIEGATRINVKFIGEKDTAINTPGPYVVQRAIFELNRSIEDCGVNDHFIVSGSLPRGYENDELLRTCRKINETGAKLILDVPGIRLSDIRSLDVFLMKPNMDELCTLFSCEIGRDQYRPYLEKLLKYGVRNVLLSLGKDGAAYMGEYGSYRIEVPSVETFSTVGAGDSLLAGFVGSLVQKKDIVSCLRTAAACAVASVMGTGLDVREAMEDLRGRIFVSED